MGSKKRTHGKKISGGIKVKGQKSKLQKQRIVFWEERLKNSRKTYTIDPALLHDYLVSQHFFRKNDFGEQQVGRLKNNIFTIYTKEEVFNEVLRYVSSFKDDVLRSCFLKQGEELLLRGKGILASLPKLEKKHYRDLEKTVRLFFKNTIVKVSANGFKLETYKKFRKLGAYIDSDKIIPRKFKKRNVEKSEFEKFLRLATNDKEHYESVCTSIGYAIQAYKNPSLTKALILSDILSQAQNEAYGRSGKGIIVKALSYIINVVEYNGKVTDLATDKFVFQNVTPSTSLIVLQDVSKNFQFESLFSTLTDSMSIERKYRSKVSIPFATSPKIALTTNYTIPQNTDSFKDRKHLVALNNFFNAENKPEQHLKKLLFDWNDDEWLSFDYFMIECVMLFLRDGLLSFDSGELKKQKVINLTSRPFFDLMESSYDELDNYWNLKKIASEAEIKGSSKSARSRITGNWIDSYAAYKGYSVERRVMGGITKICFRKKK